MNYLKASIGGIIGGLIGAVIWAAIAYFTHYEVGIIASLIGAAVGFGVRLGAGDEEGEIYGGLAIAVSILAILGGKFAAHEMLRREIASSLDAISPTATDESMILVEARKILSERKVANRPSHWPAGKTEENAESINDFPPDVAQESTARWNALPADQKEKAKADREAMFKQFTQLIAESSQPSFFSRFNFYDLLWFGFAGLAAFRLGSGIASDDD